MSVVAWRRFAIEPRTMIAEKVRMTADTLNHIRNFLRIDDGLAASGMPQPFHRSRRGREPSFQAIRVASVHGRICVATSFRLGL